MTEIKLEQESFDELPPYERVTVFVDPKHTYAYRFRPPLSTEKYLIELGTALEKLGMHIRKEGMTLLGVPKYIQEFPTK